VDLPLSTAWHASPGAAFQQWIGQTISHNRVIEKLASGGMAVVYKAEHIRLHRFIALKFLRERTASVKYQSKGRLCSGKSVC
jgi:hypothetical protein